MRNVRFLVICAAILIGGCALVQSPAEMAASLAERSGFSSLQTGSSSLRAYLRSRETPNDSQSLVIYIEGDGAPWPARSQPPRDPTPVTLLVLSMATQDLAAHVAYLGRPCQYLLAAELAECDSTNWTHGRFSETVISLMNRAIDQLKLHSGIDKIALIGHSGGGTLAALLAARRKDVSCLVTVASPLDTRDWARVMNVSALRTSLNPADTADSLKATAQTHFIGGKDSVVPSHWSKLVLQRNYPFGKRVEMQDYSHTCCWSETWQQLREQSCLGSNDLTVMNESPDPSRR